LLFTAGRGLAEHEQLMAKITENHACQAIVVKPIARHKNCVEAWMARTVTLAASGASRLFGTLFLLKGGYATLLPSMVLSGFRFAVLSLVAGRVP
jgi:hypothetical protein